MKKRAKIKERIMPFFKNRAALHQTISMLPVFMLLFLSGVTFGWLPVALYYLHPARSTVWLTKEQGSWLASFQQFGRLLVTIPTGALMDVIGRKRTILTTTVVYFVSWLLVVYLYTVNGLFVSNFMIGIAVGMVNTNCQIYTAEVTSANFRGVFHAINSFSYNSGFVVVGVLGNYLDYQRMAATIFCCTVAVFLPLRWMAESPYYSIAVGDYDLAKSTLKWLRRGVGPDTVEKEYEHMRRVISDRKRQSRKEGRGGILLHSLADPVNRKCVGLVFLLNSIAIFTGFLPIRLRSSNLLPVTPLVRDTVQYPLMIACVQFSSSIVSPFVIERFSRRALYIFSSVAMCTVLTPVAVLFYCKERNIQTFVQYATSDNTDTVLLILILLYYVIFGTVLITLLFISKGELLPQNIRANGSGLITMLQSASSILAIMEFQMMENIAGIYMNFVVFSAMSVLLGLVAYFCLPETQGLTLVKIEDDMTNKAADENEGDVDDRETIPFGQEQPFLDETTKKSTV